MVAALLGSMQAGGGEVVGEGGVVEVVNGRNGSFRRPMKRLGKKARVKMAKKRMVVFMEDG